MGVPKQSGLGVVLPTTASAQALQGGPEKSLWLWRKAGSWKGLPLPQGTALPSLTVACPVMMLCGSWNQGNYRVRTPAGGL